MKAIFVEEVESIHIKDIPKPEISETEVLVKVKYVGICGSDVHLYKGLHAFRKPPAILGHELSGEIIEKGSSVKNFEIGDRVTVIPQLSCGVCNSCKNSMPQHCKEKIVPGTAKWIGCFCEYFNVDQSLLYKLPDNVDYKTGVLVEPLAVGVHALKKISQENRKNLLILGAGAVGILALSIAKDMGFQNIMVTDIVDYNLDVAKENGADYVVNVLNKNLTDEISKNFGEEKAHSIILTAGNINILEQAIECADVASDIIYIAMITEKMEFNTYPIVFKEINLQGSMTYNDSDFEMALEYIIKDVDKYSKFITHCFAKEYAQAAFEIINSKSEGFVKILIEM